MINMKVWGEFFCQFQGGSNNINLSISQPRTLFEYCHLPALACGIDGRLSNQGYHRLASEEPHFKHYELNIA